MYVERLAVFHFRNYMRAELEPAAEGVTLLAGPNGSGKTNLLEALCYAASLRSFRGGLPGALVRDGEPLAVVSTRAVRDGRVVELDVEVVSSGRRRLRLNHQAVRRAEDFTAVLPVSVFSPDDISLAKGAPERRRDYLDNTLTSLSPKHAALVAAFERALGQRNALLRSAMGALRPSMEGVLDVWDAKVAEAGEALASAREELVAALEREVQTAYALLGGTETVELRYDCSWEGSLLGALERCRAEDLHRGSTGTGPQRDDLYLGVGGLSAKAQASRGQQRSLAFALRMGGHYLLTKSQGSSPVLLLDDVFSELDAHRSAALAACLPPGQSLVTTTGTVPVELPVATMVEVERGSLRRVHQQQVPGAL